MPDSIGPAGNASAVISVPPSRPAAESQNTENTEAPDSNESNEVPTTERVSENSNIGSNIDTTA